MTDAKKILIILLALSSIFVLPYLGAFLKYGHNFPETLFIYPALEPLHKASFNIYIFSAIGLFFLATVVLYIYPRIFGFKPYKSDEPKPARKTAKLPIWFWVSLVIWVVSLVLLWGRFEGITWYLKFIDIALWWSFSLMIDGWVYARTGGNSIIGKRPREMVGIAVASVMGWMIFEYINFFVNYNVT